MPVETHLEIVMDQFYEAFLAANFQLIGELSPQLDAALAGFDPTEDPAALERVRRKASRNASCATAAARGVRAAIRRLAEVRQNASGLVTYTEKGTRLERHDHGALSRRF